MVDDVAITPGTGKTIRAVDPGSGIVEQVIQARGLQPSATTGSVTSATSTVPATVTSYGAATVTISGTYAGVAVAFEASDDGGTTWYPFPVVRESDGTVLGSLTLASNQTVMFVVDLPGVTNLRVRATAWTSGSAAVRITPFGLPMMPAVSVANIGGGTATITTPTFSTTSGTMVAANPARRGLVVRNLSNVTAYLLYGTGTASATSHLYALAPNQTWEMPSDNYFTGAMAFVASGTPTGSVVVAEITP